MALTPIDVQQKTFGTALRGYDLDEVDDFLDEVVTSLRDYEQQLETARERIASLERQAAEGGGDASSISRALLTAQKAADGMLEEARSEADRILLDARIEAERIVDDRDEERRRLGSQVLTMRQAVEELRGKLQGLAAAVGADLVAMEEAVESAGARLETIGSDAETDEPESVVLGGEEALAADEILEPTDEGDLVDAVEAELEDAGLVGETESEGVEDEALEGAHMRPEEGAEEAGPSGAETTEGGSEDEAGDGSEGESEDEAHRVSEDDEGRWVAGG
jgi:cell division initiation protein